MLLNIEKPGENDRERSKERLVNKDWLGTYHFYKVVNFNITYSCSQELMTFWTIAWLHEKRMGWQ